MRGARGRLGGCALLAAVLVIVSALPAAAHILRVSVLPRVPVCQPDCSAARSIVFRSTVRLDSCTATDGSTICYVEMREIEWAQARRSGQWVTLSDPEVAENRMVEGMKLGDRVVVPCPPSQQMLVRTFSMAKATNHVVQQNTPNPNQSRSVSVTCSS